MGFNSVFKGLSISSSAWKYTPFTLVCVVVLYAVPVELGISFTSTPVEVDLIQDVQFKSGPSTKP